MFQRSALTTRLRWYHLSQHGTSSRHAAHASPASVTTTHASPVPTTTARHGSSSSSSPSTPPSIKGPSKHTKSWERAAGLVKNIDVTNKYLDHIRDTHDPAMHIKSLEDELRGTMGQALGKQGQKILRALRSMKEQLELYHKALEDDSDTTSLDAPHVLELAQKYNFYRKQAKTARWELIVHRQAVGFIVNNHNVVSDTYPIGPALPETLEQVQALEQQNEGENNMMTDEATQRKNITGQLDWWQKVGRWR